VTDMRRRNGVLATIAAALVAATGCASAGASGSAASPGSTGPRKEAISPQSGQRLALYSPGIRSGDFVFFSGQIGVRGAAGALETVEDQTRQALANLDALLTEAGLGRDDIVKCTVFLADIGDYQAMNGVYGEFFAETTPPARSAIAVAGLPANARVEVECMARTR
jgi:2-iminobutanoate/2-iminopropanoate deaminase